MARKMKGGAAPRLSLVWGTLAPCTSIAARGVLARRRRNGLCNRSGCRISRRGPCLSPTYLKEPSPAAPITYALPDIERRGEMEPMALYGALAIRDIRDALDLPRPVHDSTCRADAISAWKCRRT